MKKWKLKKIITYIILLLVAAGMICPFAKGIVDKFYLKREHFYAITDNISLGAPQKAEGINTKFTFRIKGNRYAGFTTLPLKIDGTKYFIKFYPLNPNRNEATTVIADSSDIKNLPQNGYKKLPHN
ncbi:hypothetical protein [Parafilimonas sp.]|uniref:hypothetical protein n=1 Tax=Parafilimonas sp. TaxID=1969739 RepID=UPI003F7FFDB0